MFEKESGDSYICKVSGHFLQVYHAFNSLCALAARWAYACKDLVGLQGLGYVIAQEVEEEEIGRECLANPLLWFVNHHWVEERVGRRGVFCVDSRVKSGVVLLADGRATVEEVKGILRKERDETRLRQLREELKKKEEDITFTAWRKISLQKAKGDPSMEAEPKVEPDHTSLEAEEAEVVGKELITEDEEIHGHCEEEKIELTDYGEENEKLAETLNEIQVDV